MAQKVRKKVSQAKAHAVEKAQKAKETTAVVSVAKQAVSFADFIRDRGIVGMAIGLAIGTVASGTIKTIVEGFVTPVVQLIVGTHRTLEVQVWHVNIWGRTADFQWGAALSSLITLIATVFVIYLLVHAAGLDRLDKKK